MFGSEKKYYEKNPVKKIGYSLLGELHVPGRLRAYHVLRKIRSLYSDTNTLNMLDAGCGRGDLVVHLAKTYPNWQIFGFETDEKRLETAEYVRDRLALQNLKFLNRNLLDLTPEMKFDLITCCDVLEHIEDDQPVIQNFYKAINPGGCLILTFPSIPQRRHLKLVKWREQRIGFQNSDYGHVRDGYSIHGITTMLKEIGFQNVECRYTFGFWGTLSFDLFFVIGDNRPNPIFFLASFPLLMTTALLDLYFPSDQGSALLVAARK